MAPLSLPHKIAVLLGSLYLCARYSGNWGIFEYLLKPATTILISIPTLSHENRRIFSGLIFSTIGDALLMFPYDEFFILGLLAFLVAHILYAWDFALRQSAARSSGVSWTSVPFGIFASAMMTLLMPGVAKEGIVVQIGVVVYILAIAFMSYKATLTGKSLLVLGTILFCISDSILAWDRFVQSFDWSEYAVMITYYSAQLCIAMSF
ncbi:hypothetical protein GGF39_000173 [Coemansia sp. RSA 1721]|nr:hypothetical protein GGF39_000173 [Coemansia sp. RSA 1721]